MTDKKKSLITIIVPVFNGERYLRESLDSILAQTYSPIEVIVMDDASTDETPEIIASYGEHRVRHYRQAQNRGIYGNMNDGIAAAQGEYIAIYHADDVYHPQIVEREVAFLEQHKEAGAVFCKDIFIDPDGRETGRLELVPEIKGGRPLDYKLILNTLLKYQNHIFRCPSCMVRASVYADIGVYRDREFFNTSDLEMYLRISKNYQVGILDEYLFSYRWGHGNSGQKYRHLRTAPGRFFPIMDLYLENGGRELATPQALKDFAAHRAEDKLMRVVNHYILNQLAEARAILKTVNFAQLLSSQTIMRGRLVVLLASLRGLTRLPRIKFVADSFYRRWHLKSALKKPLNWRDFVSKNFGLNQNKRESVKR